MGCGVCGFGGVGCGDVDRLFWVGEMELAACLGWVGAMVSMGFWWGGCIDVSLWVKTLFNIQTPLVQVHRS